MKQKKHLSAAKKYIFSATALQLARHRQFEATRSWQMAFCSLCLRAAV